MDIFDNNVIITKYNSSEVIIFSSYLNLYSDLLALPSWDFESTNEVDQWKHLLYFWNKKLGSFLLNFLFVYEQKSWSFPVSWHSSIISILFGECVTEIASEYCIVLIHIREEVQCTLNLVQSFYRGNNYYFARGVYLEHCVCKYGNR